jgi:hypothetical protein
MTDSLPIIADQRLYPPAAWRAQYRWQKDGSYVDLAGWTARLQVRVRHADTVLLDLQVGSGITLDSSGNIVILASGAQVSALEDASTRSLAYDLFLKPPVGDSVRFLMGKVLISPSISVSS